MSKSEKGPDFLADRRTVRTVVVSLALAMAAVGAGCSASDVLKPGDIATVYTWGGHISNSSVSVGGLPLDISDVQAANWGGLVIGDGDVYQWKVAKSPSATKMSASGFSGTVSIGEGRAFGAAATTSGQLWTWGKENGVGDLCLGKPTGKEDEPTKVSGFGTSTNFVKKVSGGGSHLLILLRGGQVRSCGVNSGGQLGNGSTKNASTPVKVLTAPGEPLNNIVAVSAGNDFSIALDTSGDVWEWGNNSQGQLGDGSTTSSDFAVKVTSPLITGLVKEVYAGGDHPFDGQAIALLKDGSVYSWGCNADGQLGNSRLNTEHAGTSDTPVQVNVLPRGVIFTEVQSAGSSSYALDSKGALFAWGANDKGQLGDGHQSTTPILTPVKVIPSGWKYLSVVANHVLGG